MTKRPWTDAEFEIVSEGEGRTPPRWAPLAGLGPIQQLLAVGLTVGALALLQWAISPPIGRFVNWLFAAAGHR